MRISRNHHINRVKSTNSKPWKLSIRLILGVLVPLPLVAMYILSWRVLQTPSRPSDVVPPNQPQQQQSSTRTTRNRTPDATINNNLDLYYVEEPPPPANAHCVGTDWTRRSCHYDRLCFNIDTKSYAIPVEEHDDNNDAPPPQLVSLGGINPRWTVGNGFDRGLHKIQWRPVPISTASISSYYSLEEHLMVPFHSMAGHNVGHLLWDDLLPLFALFQLFGESLLLGNNNNKKPLLIRQQLNNQTLYANCDIRRNKRIGCQSNFERFLEWFGAPFFSSSNRLNVSYEMGRPIPRSNWICGRSMAGVGLLTDHGWGDHGWDATVETPTNQLTVPHNLGRGRMVYDFSQFMLQRHRPTTEQRDFQVTFSIHSSRDKPRQLDFGKQINALAIDTVEIHCETHSMKEYSVAKQMDIAGQSSVFVTAVGGGSMTATFLPRGSVLILFYNTDKGLDFETLSYNGRPARLDWDLLNSVSHLKVHWFPIEGMDDPEHLDIFVKLIRHEYAAYGREKVRG